MIKTLEPRVRLPLGNPNGYILYYYWPKDEEQSQDNIKWGFAFFDGDPGRLSPMEEYVVRGLGSSLNISHPLFVKPFYVFKNHNTYFNFIYSASDKGVEKDTPWMFNSPFKFLMDPAMPKYMTDLQAEDYARHITRRRHK